MIQSIGDRIVAVRKQIGLTQQQFADRIGCSRSAFSNYEAGRNAPISPIIQSIIREFGVDETWLRTGNGEMFRQETRDEQIASFIGDLMRDEPDSFRKAFVAALAELSYEDWKVLERIATAVAEKAAQSEEQKPAPKSNIVKMAGRDGSYQELELTDQQLADLKQRIDSLPDVPEDL